MASGSGGDGPLASATSASRSAGVETIESQGTREATIIRGEADAEVLKIYADAFGQDPEFYSVSFS